MHFTWIIFKENIMDVGLHQNPIYFAWIDLTNSSTLELWKMSSCLLKIKENGKLF